MKLVYALRDDPEAIGWLRDTAAGSVGSSANDRSIGTEKWWNAVRDGRIPSAQIDGVITRLFEERQGDWPRFEMSTQTGDVVWTREGDPEIYQVGQRARVRYLTQELETPTFGATERPITLELWLEDVPIGDAL